MVRNIAAPLSAPSSIAPFGLNKGSLNISQIQKTDGSTRETIAANKAKIKTLFLFVLIVHSHCLTPASAAKTVGGFCAREAEMRKR
jgi:hypothetical protein